MQKNNPLPECPETPNCHQESRSYQITGEHVRNKALTALEQMRPELVTISSNRIDSVFVIPVFRFRDDMAIHIDQQDDKTVVHTRSASRVGTNDFGVNKRRIQKFYRILEYKL